MDSSEKDKFGLEKGSGDHLNYNTSSISSDWQFGNLTMGTAPTDPSIAICQGNPSVSMVDSFCSSLWNHPTNAQNLGFSENNVQTSTSASNIVPIAKPVPGLSRLDIGWNPSDSMSKGGMFLQTGQGILPPSLSHFPADSAFIERAARLSCFGGGNLGGMVNPFSTSESLSPYASKGISGAQNRMSEFNDAELPKDVSMPIDHGSNSGSPMNNQKDKRSLRGVGVSSNDSGEPEFSGGGHEETPNYASAGGDSSFKGHGSKKKKRTYQDMELDQVKGSPQLSVETPKENFESKQKVEQNDSTLATGKPTGKNAKDSPDASKEDYIHMRARRGQATNSHSLAERVRREKISERMKYLQDLVPGCSKVTGKAVMLDEIINYVQSLQRQVEFLSMKLATVNPRLDFNVEGLLSKDILQSRGGSSSAIGFSPDMIHPQLHPSQQGLVQTGISGMGNPSDVLRRAINAQLNSMNGYKEPTPQIPNAWDDELHNVLQMTFGTNAPLNTQELNGKPRDGFPI